MTISRFSTLSIDVLLIFEMHDLNGALFSNATFFSALSFSFASSTRRFIAPFTTITHRYNYINLILTLKS